MIRLSMHDVIAMEFEDYMLNKMRGIPVNDVDNRQTRSDMGLPQVDPTGKTYHFEHEDGTNSWMKIHQPAFTSDGEPSYKASIFRQTPDGRQSGPFGADVMKNSFHDGLANQKFTEVPDAFHHPDKPGANNNDPLHGGF